MPHSNVYIRGVPFGFDTEDLRYLFEHYGAIVSAKILEPRHVGDKRLGFVKFETASEALSAIGAMDKCVIAGQTLEVREAEFDVDPKKNVLDKALVENDNLFVRGFPSYWGTAELTEYFSKAGVVVSVRLLSCTMPARGGVGLVRYTSIEEAKEAIAKLNESYVEGFGPIHVKYSTVKEPRSRLIRPPFRKHVAASSMAYRSHALSQSAAPYTVLDSASTLNNDLEQLTVEPSLPKAVFVCNLPPSTTELIMYKQFAPFGAIASVTIGVGAAQICNGMAFVNFVEAGDADRAAKCLNGTTLDGSIISVMAHY